MRQELARGEERALRPTPAAGPEHPAQPPAGRGRRDSSPSSLPGHQLPSCSTRGGELTSSYPRRAPTSPRAATAAQYSRELPGNEASPAPRIAAQASPPAPLKHNIRVCLNCREMAGLRAVCLPDESRHAEVAITLTTVYRCSSGRLSFFLSQRKRAKLQPNKHG